MPDAKRIEIEIATKGDVSGAKDVGEALVDVNDALVDVTDAATDAAEAVEQTTDAVERAAEAAEDAATAVETVAETLEDAGDAATTATDAVEKVTEAVDDATDAVETVAETLEDAGDAASEAANKLDGAGRQMSNAGQQATQSWQARFFPTFAAGLQSARQYTAALQGGLQSLGSRIGGMGGLIVSNLLNPWALAATAATVGLKKVIDALVGVQQRVAAMGAAAGKTFAESGIYTRTYSQQTEEGMSKAGAAMDYYRSSLDRLVTGLRAELDAMRQREQAINTRLAEDGRLADSARALAKARIDAAEAEGRITGEQAQSLRGQLDVETAEADFERQKKAAEDLAKVRAEAAAKAKATADEAERIADAAERELAAFKGMGRGEQGAAVAPREQAKKREAERDHLRDVRDSLDPGIIARAEASAQEMADKMGATILIPTYGAIMGLYHYAQKWAEITNDVEAATDASEKGLAEVEARVKDRDKAVDDAIRAREDAAAKAREDAARARQQADALSSDAGAASSAARSYGAGGVESIIHDNRMGAMGQGRDMGEFSRQIADRLDRREAEFLSELLRSLDGAQLGRATQQKIKQIEARLNEVTRRL